MELSVNAAIRIKEKPSPSDVRAIRAARIADLVEDENLADVETEEVGSDGSVIIRGHLMHLTMPNEFSNEKQIPFLVWMEQEGIHKD